MLRCFRCGAENMDGANFCAKCNFKLPKIDTKVAPQTSAPPSARLSKILDICNSFLDGEMSPESVIEELNNQEAAFHKVLNTFNNTRLPKPLQGEFQGQLDIGIDGINLYLEALSMVRSCIPETISDDSPFELDEGGKKKVLKAMDKAREGNEKLNECYEKSSESMRKAQDEAYIYQDLQDLTEEE